MTGSIVKNVFSTKDQTRSDLQSELINSFYENYENFPYPIKDIVDRHRSILFTIYQVCLEKNALLDYYILFLNLLETKQERERSVIANFISEFYSARLSINTNTFTKRAQAIDPATIFHSEIVQ